MPNLDSILPNVVVDSVEETVTKSPIVVYDTIYKTVEKTQLNEPESAIQFVAHNPGNEIPTLLILGLVVIGVSLAVGFKILTNYIAPYLKSHYKIKQPYLMLYRVKVLVWFLFIVFSFYQLISSHLIIGLSLVIFIGLLGFTFWKDFFTGILVKLENRLKPNDYISINGVKGKIRKLKIRNLEYITQNDEIFILPYSKLSELSVAKRLNKGEERSRTITLKINENSPNNSIKAIEGILAICPWIYSHKTTTVKKISATEYNVSIYVADNSTLQKVEAFLHTHI